MIIIGLDLATQSGVCYGRPDTTPVVEVVRAPVTGKDYGLYGAFYWSFFNRLLRSLAARLEPGEKLLANFEAPILPRERWDPKQKKMVGQTSLVTTRKLHSIGVLFETVCVLIAEELGIEIDARECHIASIKKRLGGRGGAEKPDLVYAARRAGILLPAGDEAKDGADGFGAWLIAIEEQAPEFQAYWDRRLYSAPAGRLL